MSTEIEFLTGIRAVVFFEDGIRASRAVLELPSGTEEYVLIPADPRGPMLNTIVFQPREVIQPIISESHRAAEWIAALTGASTVTCIGILIFMLSS